MPEYFDKNTFQSRLEDYKTPYGAVPSGTTVTLRLKPKRTYGFSKAVMTARFEFNNDYTESITMDWVGLERNRDIYECKLDTNGYIGLVWYEFQLESLDGVTAKSKLYQLTVYDATDAVPDWFGKGMCYQIFPDRFNRTDIPDPKGLVGSRTIHRNWMDDPIDGAVGRTSKGKDIYNRDFFGGNLKGIEKKLDYLADLGVETLYLCPIFEAAENHRYGTADYSKIDPMLGEEEDFRNLCKAAHSKGMRVILDGVFNHTGFVSRYFNGDGFYSTVGAYQSKESPYYSWYQFKKWPDDYESWWGIYSLPAVQENDPSYRNFIFGGENSVVRRWLRAGADGWRLDVADELPDDFVAGIHQAVRETDPNAVVIGEVWEDGTTKISYNVRRQHLLGKHLDGLMNYPFRTAVLHYLLGGDAENFREEMETLRENYPKFAFYSAMNSLGTHDTMRILNCLGTGRMDRGEREKSDRLTAAERKRGLSRLKIGATILFTFPGAPTVYYGDEAGMEGFQDPYNRRTFPWDDINEELHAHFRVLGNLRKTKEPLRTGSLSWGPCKAGILSFYRSSREKTLCTVVNAGSRTEQIQLSWSKPVATDLLTGKTYTAPNGTVSLELSPVSAVVLA